MFRSRVRDIANPPAEHVADDANARVDSPNLDGLANISPLKWDSQI
jgi:hypothetical protein